MRTLTHAPAMMIASPQKPRPAGTTSAPTPAGANAPPASAPGSGAAPTVEDRMQRVAAQAAASAMRVAQFSARTKAQADANAASRVPAPPDRLQLATVTQTIDARAQHRVASMPGLSVDDALIVETALLTDAGFRQLARERGSSENDLVSSVSQLKIETAGAIDRLLGNTQRDAASVADLANLAQELVRLRAGQATPSR